MPVPIQSALSSEITLESRVPQYSIPSFSALTTIITQGQSLQRKGEISRSLWIRSNKLLGTIEWETSSISSTMVHKNRNNDVEHYTSGQSIRMCVSPPTWFLRKSWHAVYHNMIGEWRFTFRTYNLLDQDSPVQSCIRMGDLDGLKILFASRQATPFDKVTRNRSLLEVRDNLI